MLYEFLFALQDNKALSKIDCMAFAFFRVNVRLHASLVNNRELNAFYCLGWNQ